MVIISSNSSPVLVSLSASPMERARKITRRAIFTFLKNYHHFTSIIILLLLPFSASSLISRALLPLRLQPSSSSILLLVLGFSASVFFLAKAKSSVLRALNGSLKAASASSVPRPLLEIQSAHLLFLTGFVSAFYCLLGSPVPNRMLILWGAVYYTIDANTTIVFNLAFAVSAIRNLPSDASIREALSMRIRDSTTLFLALASSTGSAATGALFRYRMVMASSSLSGGGVFRIPLLAATLEGLLIAYLYSIIIVLDTIACFLLIDGCGSREPRISEGRRCYGEVNDEAIAAKVIEDLP